MAILRIGNLNMAFGAQVVLDNVTLQANQGDHIGLIGANGSGKSTLLKLICSELMPLGGGITAVSGLRIGYLPQNPVYKEGRTALSEVCSGFEEINSLQDELEKLRSKIESTQDDTPQLEKISMKYAELLDHFELLGGSSVQARASSIMNNLGLPERIWESDVSTLSGGERNLIGLAKLLIADYDLLLLDEPGNHLDFSGLEWLERYLSELQQTFIIVSHNRYTLDRVCDRIWELERGKVFEHTGNYSSFRADKLNRRMLEESAYKRAQKDIKRLQFNIQRLKAWSSVYDNPKLARTAKAFEKRVEDLERIRKPDSERKKLRFRLLSRKPQGDIALDIKNWDLQFENHPPLLKNVNYLISQGERAALVGDNGTGKSSMLKAIIADGAWENPNLRIGKSVKMGYYTQLGENLNHDATLIEETMRLTGLLKGSAADLLHRFLFTIDDLDKYVSILSGGEKARLQLAVLMNSGADLLLLDEPTNHLDIDSREAVEDAFEEFPGTMLIISHDRYFIDKIADRILLVQPPEVIDYESNFTEFWERYSSQLLENQSYSLKKLRQQSADKTNQEEEVSRSEKKKSKRVKFNPARFRELEEEITHYENIRAEVEEEYKTFVEKGKSSRAERRLERLSKIDVKLEQIYAEWIELGERKKSW